MKDFINYIDILKKLCKKYDIRFEVTEFGIIMSKVWGNVDNPKSLYKCNEYLDLDKLETSDVNTFEVYIHLLNRKFDGKYEEYLEQNKINCKTCKYFKEPMESLWPCTECSMKNGYNKWESKE